MTAYPEHATPLFPALQEDHPEAMSWHRTDAGLYAALLELPRPGEPSRYAYALALGPNLFAVEVIGRSIELVGLFDSLAAALAHLTAPRKTEGGGGW